MKDSEVLALGGPWYRWDLRLDKVWSHMDKIWYAFGQETLFLTFSKFRKNQEHSVVFGVSLKTHTK